MDFLRRAAVSVASAKSILALTALLVGCGARSELLGRDPLRDVAAVDAPDALDAPDAPDAPDARDASDVADGPDACVPVDDRCGPAEVCGNGVDDDCDGEVDERCACTPGSVQPCFAGPPGRRNVGACRDGAQTCGMDGTWGRCTGGIGPREDVCNGQDNLCNGCSQQRDCPILCPSPGDPRVRDGAPFQPYALRGRDFYLGPARAWRWQVRGGPCDGITRRPSFDLRAPTRPDATLFPRLSGDYTVTLTVTTEGGNTLSCTWIVHVEAPGLRVEMCYPESEVSDLDLYLHKPDDTSPWYHGGTSFQARPESCGWHNCEAQIRGQNPDGTPMSRADWGYGPSPLSECENGPQGAQWRRLGFCANPRLDIDNNLSEGTGVPENINVDNPRDGQTFRVMVQNFSGTLARPLVNIYCSGRRLATYGAPPDQLRGFEGRSGSQSVGAMWRVADVTVHVDATGRTTGCAVRPIHPPGATRGYYVTQDDPRF